MAEAHSAVAFQFSVTDAGVAFHFNKAAVCGIISALGHMIKNKWLNMKKAFLKGIFPATPLSFLVVVSTIVGLYFFNIDPTVGLSDYTEPFIDSYVGLPTSVWITILLIFESIILWSCFCYIQRFMLKFLLLYKGWMFDERGRRSLKTKIWALLVKLVAGTSHPLLGSYQQSIPRLPLPSISSTCSRYLKSVRPLMNDEDFRERVREVEKFKKSTGPRLQFYLWLKSWMSTNYVTDWWEKYVYWGWRGSVMINSNYYAVDQIFDILTDNVAARAGMYCYSAMKMKQEIENETLKPLIIQNLIPLCSYQYKRLFGTCRIPKQEQDYLFHAAPHESRHVVVVRNGAWYKLSLYHKNRILSPAEIEWMFQKILDDNPSVSPGDEHLCTLTTDERATWAETRETFFDSGLNKKNLEVIEKAAFVITLDDKIQDHWDPVDSSEKLTAYCSEVLHGNGYKFWFDKSLSVIFYKNAVIGLNAEHSWADAPIIGHLLEYCSSAEYAVGYRPDKRNHGYGDRDKQSFHPQRMHWELSKEVYNRIEKCLSTAQTAVANIDLYVMEHKEFGKGLMKKCAISPDAFIQMSLQLAHYRDVNEFSLTYEASMTRLYREGRTETVRSCTVEAVDFVLAMENPLSSKEERKRLLKKACTKHVAAYKDAMIGRGIDRHLFCLYVVSKGKKIPSVFLDKVISEKWRLSTSQTPTQQTGRIDYDHNPARICPGGGFGPVAEDGYGVSYIIPGDNRLYFHTSSFKSSPRTDSRRFSGNLKQSLRDMVELFDIQIP